MLPLLADLLPIRGIFEALTSENALGVTLILGGLLVGAYGQAGRMPVITFAGILAVIAGVLDQFRRAAGYEQEVSDRGGTTLAFIGAVLFGILLLGSGMRHRDSPLAVIPIVIGSLLLLACAGSLLLAIFKINGPLGSYG